MDSTFVDVTIALIFGAGYAFMAAVIIELEIAENFGQKDE